MEDIVQVCGNNDVHKELGGFIIVSPLSIFTVTSTTGGAFVAKFASLVKAYQYILSGQVDPWMKKEGEG